MAVRFSNLHWSISLCTTYASMILQMTLHYMVAFPIHFYTTYHSFLMGLKSGNQALVISLPSVSPQQLLTSDTEPRHAEYWTSLNINMKLHLSHSKLMYRLLFIAVLGGRKYKEVPGTEYIIWLGRYFTEETIYFLSYIFPLDQPHI